MPSLEFSDGDSAALDEQIDSSTEIDSVAVDAYIPNPDMQLSLVQEGTVDPFIEKIVVREQLWAEQGLSVPVMKSAYVYEMVTTDDVNAFTGTLVSLEPSGPEQALQAARQFVANYTELASNERVPERIREGMWLEIEEKQSLIDQGVSAFADVPVRIPEMNPEHGMYAKEQILMRLEWESGVDSIPSDIRARIGGLRDAFEDFDFTTEASFREAYAQWQELATWIEEQYQSRDDLQAVLEYARQNIHSYIAAD